LRSYGNEAKSERDGRGILGRAVWTIQSDGHRDIDFDLVSVPTRSVVEMSTENAIDRCMRDSTVTSSASNFSISVGNTSITGKD
jgi:hypothetical protein